MTTFGRYEADRPLHRTSFGTIYLLRSAEESGRQRVIKAQKPSVRMHDETLEATQSQAFLESAAVQQKVARFEAKSWAPIYEFGTSPSGPFYVTDRYDFSIQWLVDGHVKLGAEGIHNIASSIVRGLLALQQACQRPHGNLKSTNILIAGRRDMSKATIVLCDPLPDRHLDPSAHAKADLRRLGEILHQVVVHGDVPQITGYQVPVSEHWRKLGKQGEAWRHLCNRLLQANVESAPITLEDLANQLAALTPRRSRGWLLIAPIAVFVILCGVVAALLHGRPPTVEEAVKAYNECYFAKDWLGPLEQELAKSGKYMNHPWMQEDSNLAKLNNIGQYERLFLYDNVRTIADLSSAGDAPELRTKVAAANRAQKEIEALLLEPGAKSYWPWLTALGQCAAQLAKSGCHDMSNFLIGRIIPRSPPDANLPVCIDAALKLKQGWTTIDFGNLEPEAVRNDPDRGRAILALDPQGREISDLNKQGLGTPNVNEFTKRLSLLKRHYKLGEDESKVFGVQLSKSVNLALGLLDDLKDPMNEDNAAKYRERLTGYHGQLVALQSKPSLTRTQGNRDTVENLLQEMIANIEPHVANRAKWHKEIVDEAQKGISKSSRVLNDWYKSYVKARLGDDPNAFSKEHRDRTKFAGLRSGVEGTRANLVKLDGTLAPTLNTEPVKTPWSEVLRQYYETKREEILKGITEAGQSDPFPDPNKYSQQCKDLLGWPARAAGLVQDFNCIETSLDQCYLPDDPLPRPPPRTIKSLFARWNKDPNHSMVTEVTRLADAKTFSNLVEFLESIETGKDSDALRATAQDEKKPVSRRYAALWTVLQKSSSTTGEKDPGLRTMESLGRLRVSEGSKRPPEPEDFAVWVKPLVDFLASPKWPSSYDHAVFKERYARDLETRADFDRWRAGYANCERITSVTWNTTKTWKELCDGVAWSQKAGLLEKDTKKKDLWDFFSQRYNDLQSAFEEGRKARLVKEDEGKIRDWEMVVSEPKNLGTLGPIRTTEDAKRLWEDANNHTLRTLVKMVELCIKPEYCKRIDPDVKEPVKLVFADSRLPKFRPHLRPHLRQQLTGSGQFDMSQFNDNRKLAEEFFEAIDPKDPSYGWPRYIEARDDPSVILRFVPQGNDSFYLALREITNEQYETYLQKASTTPPDADLENAFYTHPYSSPYDSTSRKMKYSGAVGAPRADHPVVWVKATGAQAYAKWLEASLPTVDEYQCVLRRSYGEKPSLADPEKFHIRTQAWVGQAEKFTESTSKGQKRGSVVPPAGAEDPDGEGRKGAYTADDLQDAVGKKDGKDQYLWPTACRAANDITAGNLKTDGLALYDLIGNVWEWCEDGRCWGGSCLSSVKDLNKDLVPLLDSAIWEKRDRKSDCDLGFRIVVRRLSDTAASR